MITELDPPFFVTQYESIVANSPIENTAALNKYVRWSSMYLVGSFANVSGAMVGLCVGLPVGRSDGCRVTGLVVGLVGASVGFVGTPVGRFVGSAVVVGNVDGFAWGWHVGISVGVLVDGERVGATLPARYIFQPRLPTGG